MEDSGAESNESSNSSDGLTVSSGDTIEQSVDKKFGTYSRDFELGDADYMYQADGLSTDISGADQEITLCAWVKMETFLATMYVMSKYSFSDNNRQYYINMGSQKMQLSLGVPPGTSFVVASGGTSLSTGTWYHVCGVYNDVDLRVYLDGSLDTSGTNPLTYSSGMYDGNADFQIASRANSGSPGSYFDGLIDDVGVFDVALSSTDVNDIMDNGLFEAGGAAHRIPTMLELRNVTIY